MGSTAHIIETWPDDQDAWHPDDDSAELNVVDVTHGVREVVTYGCPQWQGYVKVVATGEYLLQVTLWSKEGASTEVQRYLSRHCVRA